jgi:hypothetical protein
MGRALKAGQALLPVPQVNFSKAEREYKDFRPETEILSRFAPDEASAAGDKSVPCH